MSCPTVNKLVHVHNYENCNLTWPVFYARITGFLRPLCSLGVAVAWIVSQCPLAFLLVVNTFGVVLALEQSASPVCSIARGMFQFRDCAAALPHLQESVAVLGTVLIQMKARVCIVCNRAASGTVWASRQWCEAWAIDPLVWMLSMLLYSVFGRCNFQKERIVRNKTLKDIVIQIYAVSNLDRRKRKPNCIPCTPWRLEMNYEIGSQNLALWLPRFKTTVGRHQCGDLFDIIRLIKSTCPGALRAGSICGICQFAAVRSASLQPYNTSCRLNRAF